MASLPPQLVSLIAQFESASAEAAALASAAGDEVFARRPDPQRWSAAYCIAHLTATNERYLKYLEQVIAEAEPSENRRYEPTFVGRIFKGQMEPGRRLRFRAPKVFVPPGESGPRDEVLAAFQNSQQRMTRAIEAAAGLDFSRVKMRSPASRFLKLNLWDAFQALAAHERRHLLQAKNAIEGR